MDNFTQIGRIIQSLEMTTLLSTRIDKIVRNNIIGMAVAVLTKIILIDKTHSLKILIDIVLLNLILYDKIQADH